MKHIKLFLILGVLLIACQQKKIDKVTKEEKYLGIKDKMVLFDTLQPVKVNNADAVKNWKEYHQVKQLLSEIKTTTPNEVLGIADELVKKVVLMRDTIRRPELKKKGMRARLNGLYNQALRLQEMKSIPAITVPEIQSQTQGLFVLFNMINNKINAIDKQIDFEKELIEDDFIFSKIDSIQ